jgi:hypothetical protein
MDAETGPGAVAGGGEDWKATETAEKKLKRARSPEDEGDGERTVCPIAFVATLTSCLLTLCAAVGCASTHGRN